MKREITFRAWIPDLKIMLQNITLYHDGMMGYDAEEFEMALPEKHELTDDEVYHKDFENGNDIFERVMSVLPGEDWIWLEKGNFEPMQFTGLKDKNGKEIYEGDIVSYEHLYAGKWNGVIVYNPNDMAFWLSENSELKPSSHGWGMMKSIEIIGNIYENADILTANAEAGGKN